MPGFDGTGPRGMGAMTGGGRGYCAPGAGPPYGYGAEPVRGAGRGGVPWGGGRGRAWGGGRGRGWVDPYPYGAPPQGAGPYAVTDAAQEMEVLSNQASFLAQELDRIRKRIDALSGKKDEKE